MRIALSHDVPGVEPAAALAWWSDFREGHADHGFVPGTQRRIHGRAEGETSMEEVTRWLGITVFREHVRARVGEDDVRFAGTNNFSSFDGRYAFEPMPGGTTIRLAADIRLRRGLRWADVAAVPVVEAILRADLRGHAKDMQRELSRG